MLRNNEKATRGGAPQKTNCACLETAGRAFIKPKGLWRSPRQRCVLASCVLVLEVWSARGWKYSVSYKWSYIIAADGRGAPGIKEPLSTPLL